MREINLLICIILLAISTSPNVNAFQFDKTLPKQQQKGNIAARQDFVLPPNIDDEELFPIVENKKVGFINAEGKTVIAPQFDLCNSGNGFVGDYAKFSEGLAMVAAGGKMGFIDKTGNFVIEPQFADAQLFSEDLAAVRVFDGSQFGGKWGFIDKTGKYVIAPQFTFVHSFADGLAIVIYNGKSRYIDKTGEIFLPQFGVAPRHVELRPFAEGLAWVGDDKGEIVLVNRHGETIKTPHIEDFHEFSDGLAGVRIKEKWGFINTEGKIVIAPKFSDYSSGSDIGYFSGGLAQIKFFDKIGFINRSGKLVIPAKYDDAGDFYEELASVSRNDKYGFINKQGKIVIPFKFKFVFGFHNGMANVDVGGKVGFVDKTGRMVIKAQFNFFAGFEGKLALQVIRRPATLKECQDVEWGYINRQGKFVWKIKHSPTCDS